MRVGEGLSGISLKERKGKYFKKGGIDSQKICFCIGLLLVADDHVVGTIAGEGSDFRELVLEGGSEREGEPGMDRNVVVQVIFHDYPEDVFGTLVILVIGELVSDPKKNQDGTSDSDSQACDADKRIPLLPAHLTERHLDGVQEEGRG
jgi:hypothetical protein